MFRNNIKLINEYDLEDNETCNAIKHKIDTV